MLRDIRFRSVCEHHLLPFRGHAHIAYLPGEQVVGLGALPKVVDILASRPQVQERLGEQIADMIAASLDARGVLVVLDAAHECVTMRGGRQPDASTVTIAARGELAEPAARAELDRAASGRVARMTTLIMGIVNVTPDSFSDGGRYLDADAAIAHGLAAARGRAPNLLDVGGESTRPGAERVAAARGAGARAAGRAGARRSGRRRQHRHDERLHRARRGRGGRAHRQRRLGRARRPRHARRRSPATDADVVLGHWRGPSADMYARAEYADVVAEVLAELGERVDAAAAAGIPPGPRHRRSGHRLRQEGRAELGGPARACRG